jgi:hypothetical protein
LGCKRDHLNAEIFRFGRRSTPIFAVASSMYRLVEIVLALTFDAGLQDRGQIPSTMKDGDYFRSLAFNPVQQYVRPFDQTSNSSPNSGRGRPKSGRLWRAAQRFRRRAISALAASRLNSAA